MNPAEVAKDLIVLTADTSMSLVLEKLLQRVQHLGFHEVISQVIVHPDRDPGVFRRSHELLRSYSRRYRHAMAICDREGSGSGAPREEMERLIEERLAVNGWDARACAVVIDPELEIWMWGDWACLTRCTRWEGDAAKFRAWLRDRQLLEEGQVKPERPKEALQAVLKSRRVAFSSAIHQEMAARADTTRCVDSAFGKLRSTLQAWFPL
jgi:hypothetical protein